MSARKVFSLICMILSLLLIGAMFLPYLEGYKESISMWDNLEATSSIVAILYIVTLVVTALLFMLQLVGAFKENRTVFLPVGYVFVGAFNSFLVLVDKESLSYTDFGFWCFLIVSFIIVILAIISNFVSNESKPKYRPAITGYDPKTGQPIYANQNMQPRFDPKTGKPLY